MFKKAVFISFASILATTVFSATVSFSQEPAATSPKAKEYLALAQKYKPKNSAVERSAKMYMGMSADERKQVKSGTVRGFDVSMPWDYIAYAVCFYSGLAGGGTSDQNIIDAGDKCHDQHLN